MIRLDKNWSSTSEESTIVYSCWSSAIDHLFLFCNQCTKYLLNQSTKCKLHMPENWIEKAKEHQCITLDWYIICDYIAWCTNSLVHESNLHPGFISLYDKLKTHRYTRWTDLFKNGFVTFLPVNNTKQKDEILVLWKSHLGCF